MRILFKVFPQKSHLNATFPLARTLRAHGHDVIYAGVEQLRWHVEVQGHRYSVQNRDIFPYLEPGPGAPKLTGWTMLRETFRHRAWAAGLRARQARCAVFDELVQREQPDLVLVDSPYAVFALNLMRLGVPFALLESMGNLGRAPGFPPGDTTHVPRGGWTGRLWAAAHWQRYYLKRWLMGAAGIRLDFNRAFVREMARANRVDPVAIDFERYFHLGLTRVPEFILSPREFDFPRAVAPNQYHIGPSVELDREEAACDYRFNSAFGRLVRARKKGTPLVYCSLGTAAWRYAGAEKFIARVVAAARGATWNLLLATGTELELPPSRSRPENVEIFQVVPQLQVLRNCDAMITHGGMNSITECLLTGVPMAVCPGTTQIDQGGNAARVAFHQLGLTGGMKQASVAWIRRQLDRILHEPAYRRRVEAMGRRIRDSRAYADGAGILLDTVRRHYPGLDKGRPRPRDSGTMDGAHPVPGAQAGVVEIKAPAGTSA